MFDARIKVGRNRVVTVPWRLQVVLWVVGPIVGLNLIGLGLFWYLGWSDSRWSEVELPDGGGSVVLSRASQGLLGFSVYLSVRDPSSSGRRLLVNTIIESEDQGPSYSGIFFTRDGQAVYVQKQPLVPGAAAVCVLAYDFQLHQTAFGQSVNGVIRRHGGPGSKLDGQLAANSHRPWPWEGWF